MLFWLALATFIIVTAAMVALVRGNRSIRFLRDVPAALPPQLPRVSLIVAARNEERNLEGALASLLTQDYPALEVIVVDDRSTDATPEILARAQARHPKLRVVRIDTLPAGWLGKNHALDRGAAQAAGDILIFADADIVMHPDAVSRAVAHALAASRDHLAITPEMIAPGRLLGMFMSARRWAGGMPRRSGGGPASGVAASAGATVGSACAGVGSLKGVAVGISTAGSGVAGITGVTGAGVAEASATVTFCDWK